MTKEEITKLEEQRREFLLENIYTLDPGNILLAHTTERELRLRVCRDVAAIVWFITFKDEL